MVDNKLGTLEKVSATITQSEFRPDNCLKIFTTLCNYKAMGYTATSLKFLKLNNPLPLIVFDDINILVIYEKKIFDAIKETPIKATQQNFTQYLLTPHTKKNFTLTYYVLVQLPQDENDSTNQILSDAS